MPGYDMVIQGESGLMDVTGFPETGPTKVGVAITDCLAALYAVQGILLAHISRGRTGKGQFLDIALLDSAVSVLGLPAGIVAATGKSPGTARQRTSVAGALRAVSRARRPGHRRGRQSRACGRGSARRSASSASSTMPRFATNDDRLANRAALNDDHPALFAARRWTRCSNG